MNGRGCRGLAGLLLILLTGCGSDKPYQGASAPPPLPPSPPAAPPAILSSTPPPAPSDQSDPLLNDSARTPPDPLLSAPSQTPADPLIGQDPLKDRTIPTEHTHWLRGRIQGAQVIVRLNNIRLGTYSGLTDQDISRKILPGINSVTFQYLPLSSPSMAEMAIFEGEHDPDIRPLATFRSRAEASANNSGKSAPKTFTFVAK